MTPFGPYLVLGAEKHDAGPSYPSFFGFLDELRIWNTALSHAQIQLTYSRTISPDATGLVGQYRRVAANRGPYHEDLMARAYELAEHHGLAWGR